MKALFRLCFLALALCAAYVAGQRGLLESDLPARILGPLEFALSRVLPSGVAPPSSDSVPVEERLADHLSALRTQRERIEFEQRLLALEQQVLTRWGEADGAAAGPRAEQAQSLAQRHAALTKEIEEIEATERALALAPSRSSSQRGSPPSPELRAARIAREEARLARELTHAMR